MMMKGLANLAVRDVPGGAVLLVKAVAGSSRDRVAGVLGDCLKVTVSAPAERGKANAAVAAVLARALGLRANDVQLLAGAASPRKEFLVPCLSAEQVRRRLAEL